MAFPSKENQFSGDYAVESAHKSHESRKKKLDMRSKMSIVMTMALKIGDIPELDEIQSIAELNGMNMDVETAICLQQAMKALKKQDTKAAEFCRDTSGQQVTQKITVAEVDPEVIAEVENIVLNNK